MGDLLIILFFVIPIAAVTFFIISLCSFLSVRKKTKLQPDSVNMQEYRKRKIMMIISSIIAGVLMTIVICFCVLIALAVQYM